MRGPGARDVPPVVTAHLSGKTALADKLIDGTEPTLGQFIVGLNGRVLHTATGDVRMSTSKVVGVGTNRRCRSRTRTSGSASSI